ncbi:MAG: glycerol kinase GlpK [Spirochaetaceae bacterium]|nr:glycerol kinase GlpK [Spirochaetaceae bacterium]
MTQYLIALDQGTTSSRTIIFDKQSKIVGLAQKEFKQIYPQPGWVEHDPYEIWASQLATLKEVCKSAGITAKQIAAIALTNQRESTLVWDKTTGEPIYNTIVWQCRRTAGHCDELKAKGFDKVIKDKTGLIIDAYFSATKLSWLLDNIAGARVKAESGQLLFGTVDSWLLWQLTKGEVHATDYSNASRTMLFNIHTLQWDNDLLKEFNIPLQMLPQVKPSSYLYGYSAAEFLGHEIPISGVIGDQQAALFGQGCFEAGAVKNTYGTGCFILMNTGAKAINSQNGLITTIAWGVNNQIDYALEGSIFVAGAAIQWLRDELQLLTDVAASESYATAVNDNGGVYVVPAFVGLGAPYWQQHVSGLITGLRRNSSKAHLIRATLESLAYQSCDVIKAMQADAAIPLKHLYANGGASNNNFLMQFQADILNTEVIRPAITESTALGAAYLAGLAVGYYKDKADIIKNITATGTTFKPLIDDNYRTKLLNGWQQAIKQALT